LLQTASFQGVARGIGRSVDAAQPPHWNRNMKPSHIASNLAGQPKTKPIATRSGHALPKQNGRGHLTKATSTAKTEHGCPPSPAVCAPSVQSHSNLRSWDIMFMRRTSTKIWVLVIGLMALHPQFAAAEGVRMLIESDGIDIEAFVFGEGSETLIIAAGNGRPAEQLTALAEGIAAQGIRVVTYNYRSIGASTGSIDGLTLHDWANDLWRVADGLSVQKVHLAGKTYGNRVVRTASQDRPDRVLSVTLIGAGGERLPDEETQILYKRYLDPATPKDEWLKLQAELMYAPGNEYLAAKDAEQGEFPELASAQNAASEATPKEEWAMGGTAPMLVLTCLQDRVAVPESALSVAMSRRGAWLVGLPSCGHNMINEQGEALVNQTSDFILGRSFR
jgi:pimeloyl-ACP methyl ester carboxylesterase